jgi:hypothetical protein
MAKSLSLTLTYGKDNLVTITESAPGSAASYKFQHSNRAHGPFTQVATTFNVSGGKITFSLPTSVVNAFGEQEYYQVTLNDTPVYTGSIYINVPPAQPASSAPSTPTDLSNYYNKAEVDAKDATKTTDSTITTVGRNVITAATAAAARTAIGAGTSSLAIGTTGTTAKAGNYAPTSADISDATATGKGLLTAADAAAARTAIGAGTSNLVIGTTSTTAKAGDYAPAISDVTGLQAALNAKGTVKTVNNVSPDGNGNVTVAGGTSDPNWFAERSTSTCQTIPFGLGNGTNTITGGTITAGLAINRVAKTYTAARFLYVSHTTAPTDLYVGVWDSSGTLIGATGTIVPTVGAMCSGTFATPITLTAGQQVYVGLAVIGGSAPAFLRYNYAGAAAGVAGALPTIQPTRLSWTMSGNTNGSATPPNLTGSSVTSILYWVELY